VAGCEAVYGLCCAKYCGGLTCIWVENPHVGTASLGVSILPLATIQNIDLIMKYLSLIQVARLEI
jgi:hypothetical protein